MLQYGPPNNHPLWPQLTWQVLQCSITALHHQQEALTCMALFLLGAIGKGSHQHNATHASHLTSHQPCLLYKLARQQRLPRYRLSSLTASCTAFVCIIACSCCGQPGSSSVHAVLWSLYEQNYNTRLTGAQTLLVACKWSAMPSSCSTSALVHVVMRTTLEKVTMYVKATSVTLGLPPAQVQTHMQLEAMQHRDKLAGCPCVLPGISNLHQCMGAVACKP